jgi:7,8-dihydropterin-6-yl-methyl-4-(beta-D-ribofuranosyl)aminobenzene 5'-phosphate synthase
VRAASGNARCEITILADNNTSRGDLCTEHGFAAAVQYGDTGILVDAGQGTCLCHNAQVLGIPLGMLTAAVLSHGHFDHGNGLAPFYTVNTRALLYMHSGALKDRYSTTGDAPHQIGLSAPVKLALAAAPDRIRHADRPVAITDTVILTGAVLGKAFGGRCIDCAAGTRIVIE